MPAGSLVDPVARARLQRGYGQPTLRVRAPQPAALPVAAAGHEQQQPRCSRVPRARPLELDDDVVARFTSKLVP